MKPADIISPSCDFDIQLPLNEAPTKVATEISLSASYTGDTGTVACIVDNEERFSNEGNKVECTSAIHEFDSFESFLDSGMYL